MRRRSLQGVIPTEKYWAITSDWINRFKSLSPQLYATMRENPARFAEMSRQGMDVSAPFLALGNIAGLIKARGKKKPANGTGTRRKKAEGGEIDDDPPGTPGDDDDDYYEDDEDDDYSPSGSCSSPAPYDIVGGVALLSICGPMTKKPTSAQWLFGGTSTVLFRKKLSHAHTNPEVGAILIDVDSGGGTVAGTADLADHIARVAKDKPVEAHVPDVAASAAYWAISNCRKITAGRSALVGSIGVYMVVEDFSKMYAEAGVKVWVFTNDDGEFKAAGEEGTELTEAQKADFKREVNDLNFEFAYVSVKTGRGLTDEQVKAINTGQVWKGEDLLRLRLVDAIGTYDSVLTALSREVALSGKIVFPDAIPGAARSSSANAERIEGPGSGYPKTGDPIEAAIGSAFERAEAERPALLLEAAEAGANVSRETPPPAPSAEMPTAVPSAEADDPGANPETPPPAVENDGTQVPQETEEVTETMGNEQNVTGAGIVPPANPNAAAAPVVNAGLVAALARYEITTAEQLNAVMALASDGQMARKQAVESISANMTRIQGANKTDTEGTALPAVDFAAMYGNLPLANLTAIADNAAATWKTMATHAAQREDPAGNPLGSRMTTAGGPGTLSPGIAAALNAPKAGSKEDPTGLGIAPVDPAASVAAFNKQRDSQTEKALGFHGTPK